MIDARAFTDKINEIQKRMDYVIENWGSNTITLQEKRFVLSTYIHGLYKNEKVKDLAKDYLRRIKERRRLDFETVLTAIASALIVNEDFSEYWDKLKEKIDRSSPTEKFNLIIQFLVILTPKTIKKINNLQYIKTLLENLKRQDMEKKLFSYWIKKCLFSEKEQIIIISQNEIKHLKDYLLWELVNLRENKNHKEKLREKFIFEVLNYRINQVDWIAFLMYQFLRKNKPIIITEVELNKKIKYEVKGAISKKVWFPLIFSMIFVLVKLYLANAIAIETIGQIFILVLGASFLFFEEKLPSFEIPIKRHRITFGQIGEFMIIASILWAANLIPLIKEMLP